MRHHANLVGVLSDDGRVESEGPGAAAELLAGGGRGGDRLTVSRLRHVAIHKASEEMRATCTAQIVYKVPRYKVAL